jgi:hypothetical protein
LCGKEPRDIDPVYSRRFVFNPPAKEKRGGGGGGKWREKTREEGGQGAPTREVATLISFKAIEVRLLYVKI